MLAVDFYLESSNSVFGNLGVCFKWHWVATIHVILPLTTTKNAAFHFYSRLGSLPFSLTKISLSLLQAKKKQKNNDNNNKKNRITTKQHKE